jgi:hypothetical protein
MTWRFLLLTTTHVYAVDMFEKRAYAIDKLKFCKKTFVEIMSNQTTLISWSFFSHT